MPSVHISCAGLMILRQHAMYRAAREQRAILQEWRALKSTSKSPIETSSDDTATLQFALLVPYIHTGANFMYARPV
jgi:hypothetical protein